VSNFKECFAVREEADMDGVRFPLIRLEDLITDKRASGRLKDLADVQELE
jgi:predicted nucleotidyltransferase